MKSNRSTWITAGLMLSAGLLIPSLIASRPGVRSGVPASSGTGVTHAASTAGTLLKVRREGGKPLRHAAPPRDEEWDVHEQWVLRCVEWSEGRLPDPNDVEAFRLRTAGAPEEALAWISSQGPANRRHDLLAAFCAEWGSRDFPAAWRWATARQDDREALAVMAGLAARGEFPPDIVAWLYELPASRTLRISLAMRLWEQIAEPNAFHAATLGLQPYERHSWAPIALKAWTQDDPLSALARARDLQDANERNGGVATVLGTWPNHRFAELHAVIPSLEEVAWLSLANEILNRAVENPPLTDPDETASPRTARPVAAEGQSQF